MEKQHHVGPKITVLMTVYNGERYLKEAINSILAQTYTDFEFIIIDDASMDGTSRILNSYTKHGPNFDSRIIIVTNNSNFGLTKSLNIGLRIANGEYIARMDADDISMPARLAMQKEILDTHEDIAVLGGGSEIINETGKSIGVKKMIENSELIGFRMITANQLAHPTVMFRKSIILANNSYNECFKYVQDYDLWSRLIEKNYTISNIREPLIKYRYHQESLTQNLNSKEIAYNMATKVIKRNMSRYAIFSENEFRIFFESAHRQVVGSLACLLKIMRLWSNLKKAYLEKEKISMKNRVEIKRYILLEQIKVIRWYVKTNFGFFYGIFKGILKPKSWNGSSRPNKE